MNIAICDDNEEFVGVMEDYIDEAKIVSVDIDAYYDGESLVSAYQKNGVRYDVIFLDMEMDGINGIETANLIREFDDHVLIVFVTSHKEYVFESFKCAPFRFLVKPLKLEEFKEVFNDIYKKISSKIKIFHFTENKTRIRLLCDDIIYCESQNHCTLIHTANQTYKLFKSLSDIHEQLDKNKFCRIHKSYIVNFSYTDSITKSVIVLKYSGKHLPISRSYKISTLKAYADFMERDLLL